MRAIRLGLRLDQRLSWRSIEPTGSSTDPLPQSQALAILFLTSDTAPRLKLASLIFPSLLRVVLIDSFPLSGKGLNESHGVWSKSGAAIH